MFAIIAVVKLPFVSAGDCDDGFEKCILNLAGGGDPTVAHVTQCETACNMEHAVNPHYGNINLLEPLDEGGTGMIEVDPSHPLQAFIDYFNSGYEWLLVVGTGIVILWILICGAAIMITGDQSKTWRGRITAAIIGLICLFFMGAILNALNANFFTAS